jgi:L-glyceraldehyde 3-phosphate reductase
MTSLVIGASSVRQLEDNVAALRTSLTDDELTAIDHYATEAGIDLWKGSTDQ